VSPHVHLLGQVQDALGVFLLQLLQIREFAQLFFLEGTVVYSLLQLELGLVQLLLQALTPVFDVVALVFEFVVVGTQGLVGFGQITQFALLLLHL